MNVNRMLDKPMELQPSHVVRLWRERPKIWMQDVLCVTPLAWQEDAIDLYTEHNRLGLVASKGVGKTWLLSALALHFLTTRHFPKMAALSVSKDHLQSNLWAELLKMRAQTPLLAKTLSDGAKRIALIGHEGYCFIDARAYPKEANQDEQASALAGLHADNVAFVIDEAGKIPDAVIITADAALSTGDDGDKCAKMILTGNPEEPKGLLYRAVKGKSLQRWGIMKVSGDPEDPKRSPLVSKTWAQEMIDMFGRDNPWVKVNVFGEYPDVSTTSLLTEDEIDAAMKRTIENAAVKNSQSRMGIDVARGGIDSSAIVRRQGLKVWPIEMVPSNVLGPELAGKAALLVQDNRIERIFVDNTGGYGSSVIDSLQLFPRLDVTPVVYNSRAQDQRYYNKRTEMWVRMRDWVKKGGCLPYDKMLAEELMMPLLLFHGGVMRLEEKEQIKKRLGRSPDRADALAQTFADVEEVSFFYESSSETEEEDPWEMVNRRRNQSNHISEESQIDKYYKPPPNYRA